MNDADRTYDYDYAPGGSTYRCNQDCMIIESQSRKRVPLVQERKPLELCGETLPDGCDSELALVQEKVQTDPYRTLKPHCVIRHLPENEKDKNLIFEQIEMFLRRCRKPGGNRKDEEVGCDVFWSPI